MGVGLDMFGKHLLSLLYIDGMQLQDLWVWPSPQLDDVRSYYCQTTQSCFPMVVMMREESTHVHSYLRHSSDYAWVQGKICGYHILLDSFRNLTM